MIQKIFIIIVVLGLLSCNQADKSASEGHEKFDRAKWAVKDGDDFPNREKMIHELLEQKLLQGKTKPEILKLLGEPTREDNGYLFYLIAQERIGFFPLHTKTLVIKFRSDDIVEWVKIHK